MLPIKFNKDIASKLKDKEQADKIKAAKKSVPKSNNMFDIIEQIRIDVETNLGKFKDQYQCIRDKETLKQYILKANAYGELAIDTETTGLNPLVDDIVGLCLYFPEEKPTYVPINHYDFFSNTRLPNQLTEDEIGECLSLLTTKNDFHNAPFDIRVLKNTCKVRVSVDWDTLSGGQLLDENEEHGLKYLHGKYVSSEDEKTFGDLFGKMSFKYVPIEYAYLYAAHDAIDTFELTDYQKRQFNLEDNQGILWLLKNIEIPLIDAIVDLEDNGVAVDMDYLDTLKEKYQVKLDNALETCNKEIMDNYLNAINKYNESNLNKPFNLPPNISSSSQMSILFYDILGCKKVDDKKMGCTDEDCMKVFAKDYPIAKYILDYRAAQKILSTYVLNIYEIVHTDGRVHTHFNANGARTGRLSSSNPINLQNIPSHATDIRKMFVGQTTYRDVDKRSDGGYIFDRCEEIQMQDETWKFVEQVKPGDILIDGSIVKVVKVKELRVLIALQ